MPTVTFTQLTLKGFGKYKDSITVDFAPEINLLLANNESGKSTLATGLLAVIFGLPTSSDTAAFGTAKYRNWDGAAHFSGDVHFERDKLPYHIARDFNSQSIRVRIRLEGDRWQDLIRGVHNPRANKPNVKYLDFLQQTFGMQTAELFRQTFFLEQPLPPSGSLSLGLQQLLSGGEHFKVVTERLKSELRGVTRYANSYYGGVNVGRKDQVLEQVVAHRKELEYNIATNKDQVDSLQQVIEQLSQAEAAHRQAEEQVERTSMVKDAFDLWRTLRDRCAYTREKKSLLERTVEHIAKLEEEVHLLQENSTSGQAYSGEKATMEQAEAKLTQFSELTGLGEQPLEVAESVKLWADDKVRHFRQLADLRREHTLSQTVLQTRFGLLEQADSASLEKIKGYNEMKARLSGEIGSLEQTLQHMQATVSKVSLLQRDIEAQLFAVEKLSPGVADSLEQVAQLKERMLQLGGLPRVKASPPVWPLVMGAISGLALYSLWGREAGVMGVAVPLGLLLTGLLVRNLMGTSRRESVEQQEITKSLAEYESFAKVPLSQLPVLAMKIRQYEELHSTVSPVELADKEKRLETAKATERTWFAEVEPFLEAFAEPESAYHLWQKHRELVEKLGERVEQLEVMLGTALPAAELPGLTSRMLKYMGLMDIRATCGAELYAALECLPVENWQQTEIMVRQYLAGQAEVASASEAFQRKKEVSENQVKTRVAVLNEALRSNDVSSLGDLRDKAAEVADTYYLSHREWREHIEKHPGLPGMEEAKDTSTVFARHEEVKRQALVAAGLVKQWENTIRDLSFNLSRLEGKQLMNLAAAEEELSELVRREAALQKEAQAIGIAAHELDMALLEFQETYRDRLAASISHYFSRITENPRHVSIDDNLSLTVLQSDGQVVAVSQLSQGAQDQLYVALRLGVADLTSGNVQIPLILDDPFLTSDDERLERIREALRSLDRQIILLSHSPRFADWGTEITKKQKAQNKKWRTERHDMA